MISLRTIKHRMVVFALPVILAMLTGACKTISINYSFGGVSINYNEIQTVSVDYFPNRAPVVQAQLSQLFTDALIDKIQSNTKLELVPSGGHVSFSGENIAGIVVAGKGSERLRDCAGLCSLGDCIQQII